MPQPQTEPAHALRAGGLSRAVQRPGLLIPAMFVIAILSLSVHVVMLQVLHVPYPAVAGVGRWGLVLVTMRVLALMIVYRLAAPGIGRHPLFVRIAVIAVLDVTVQGGIRSAIMAGVVTADPAFPAIGFASDCARSVALALLVVGAQSIVRPSWAMPLAAVAVTAAMVVAIDPVIRTAVAPFAYLQRPEIHAQPYGVYVLSWSYAAFVETVAAALGLARLIASRLSPRPLLALIQFAALLLLLRGTLVMQLLFPWFMTTGFASASLSTSQFFLQDVVLAALVWSFWRGGWAEARRGDSLRS